MLTDGTKLDSGQDCNDPLRFSPGGGQGIRGWDEGLQGMRVGGVRRLTVAPALGYGSRGTGGVIPPSLVFEVQRLAIG